VRAVQTGPLTGLIALVVLLGAFSVSVGLSGAGWVVGLASGVITSVALAGGLVRHRAVRLGPADRVTLTRATLVCGVAALTADSFSRPAPVVTLVSLTVVALVLDAVDGWVARRTGSASTLGARFDMEVDAFLILVLSVYVARSTGAWVLAIGVARYAFVAARWPLPWMRGTVAPRHWCKVVAATQGVVLAFVAADIAPLSLANVLLAASLALLAESFGREIWWLWHSSPGRQPAQAELQAAGAVGDG
jgi:phosphatidylglycerophosphate synthase